MSFEPGEIGAWSSRGEFLGLISDTSAVPEDSFSGEHPDNYLHVGRGGTKHGVSVVLHRFVRGGEEGYRVRVHQRNEEGESSYWIAPTVEDEGYIGMFTEEEVRRDLPYLLAALEMPGGFEIG